MADNRPKAQDKEQAADEAAAALVTAEEQAQARQRLAAREMARQGGQRRDETVPGGRYLVDGQMVNAEGQPVKGGD